MSIHLAGLTHRFGPNTALRGVDLHLARGDIYGFIGHNGAGKTTTLRIALGLLRPDTGTVWIDGHDLAKTPQARALLGGLIERPGFFDHFSGQKNLRMLARLHHGPDQADTVASVDAWLARVGLQDAGRKPVGQYSQGMRQRLGLAQALLAEPRYLLLDEPMNGLDPEGIHDLRQLLQELAATTGVTVLLSSHRLHEVADLCNRIGVLHQGELLVEATTTELLHSDQRRFLIDTDDNAMVADWIAKRDGLAAVAKPDGTLQVTVETGDPSALVAELVAGGRRILAWSPVRTTLEQIYLDYTRGNRSAGDSRERSLEPPAATDADATADATAKGDIPPPRRAIARICRYEATRSCRPLPILALLAPTLIAPIVIFNRNLALQRDAGELAQLTLASASDVTAFEALGRALQTSLPLLAVVMAALASQSLASELGSGTLRNLLIRPFRRTEVAIGKFATLLCTAFASYAVLLAGAAATAGAYFDYGDLVEILSTNGATFPLLSAAEVWPELWPALASPLLPLAAWTAIGFLCGTIARTAAGALAWMGGAWVALELSRALLRNFDAERWLPGPYLPSPLANNSHVDYFVSFATGTSNATNEFASSALLVPAAWTAGSFALALLVLRRRYVA